MVLYLGSKLADNATRLKIAQVQLQDPPPVTLTGKCVRNHLQRSKSVFKKSINDSFAIFCLDFSSFSLKRNRKEKRMRVLDRATRRKRDRSRQAKVSRSWFFLYVCCVY